jgi:hypothetical protein
MISSLYSQSARPIIGVAENMAPQKDNPSEGGARAAFVTEQKPAASSGSAENKTEKSNQSPPQKTGKDGVDLNSPEVQKMLSELKSRDIEVKAHEQAHLAAAGQYATSGAHYSYQTGPDGKQYAIGGDVGIDTSAVDGDPQATLSKAQQVYAAAMAPAQPSSQDFKVAQSAQNMMSKALTDIQSERQDALSGTTNAEKSGWGQSEVSAKTVESDKPLNKNREMDNTQSENKAIKSYRLVDTSSNERVGQIGGWQNNANRIGLSFQA